MNKERKILVTAISKALTKPHDKQIEASVQNCTSTNMAEKPVVTPTTKVVTRGNEILEIPKGEFLYGLKLNDGRYLTVVAEDIIHACSELHINISDVKRATPIIGGK